MSTINRNLVLHIDARSLEGTSEGVDRRFSER